MQHHFLSRQSIIDWLIIEKSGQHSSEDLITGIFATDWLDESLSAYTMRCELGALSDEMLLEMHENRLAHHRDRLQRAKADLEAGLYFNKPGAFADYGFFARQLLWTVEQAVALSLGRKPEVLNSTAIASEGQDAIRSDLANEYEARLKIAYSWIRAGQLDTEATPGKMLAWLQRAHLVYPDELAKAVESIGHQVADWKTLYDEQVDEKVLLIEENQHLQRVVEQWAKELTEVSTNSNAMITELKAELEEANATIEKLGVQCGQASKMQFEAIDARERNTLHKILYSVAVQKYRFDPEAKQSSVPTNIESATDREGLHVSSKTIKRHLDLASQLPRKSKQ